MIEVGKTYNLKYNAYGARRWGSKFKVRKVTEHDVVCGFWINRMGPAQHGCIKLKEFEEMIEENAQNEGISRENNTCLNNDNL